MSVAAFVSMEEIMTTSQIPYVTGEELRHYVSNRFGVAADDHDGFLRAVKKLCRIVDQLARLGDRDAVLQLVSEIKRNGLAD